MRSIWRILLLILLAAFSACKGSEESTDTTPPSLNIRVISADPVKVSLDELADGPAAYEGVRLQLTGQFSRLPRLFCNEDPNPSPATWGLTAGTFMALAGGFDSQLRSLLPDGHIITVAGRWERWEGLVGCGKRANLQEIWYLQVDEIVSPSPLALVTLTPIGGIEGSGEEGQIATPTWTATAGLETSDTPGNATPETDMTPDLTQGAGTPELQTGTAVAAANTQAPTGLGTPSATVMGTGPSPATVSVTSTPSGGSSATPTTTSAPSTVIASATPTLSSAPTSGPGTPSATPTPLATATTALDYTVVNQGSVSPEEIVAGQIGTREVHSWTFSVGASETISVSVAASPSVNVILSVVNSQGSALVQRDLVGAGEIENIQNFQLSAAGDYQVRIQPEAGVSASYAMMLLYRDSYKFVPMRILVYGESRSVQMAGETDHFWFFQGSAGEKVTITLIPNDSGDLFLELYGPDGMNIGGFVDEGGSGEQEQLSDFVLPGPGMYSIRVGEYEFLPTNYSIILAGS